jgi:hypothetical protein
VIVSVLSKNSCPVGYSIAAFNDVVRTHSVIQHLVMIDEIVFFT